MVQYLAAGIVCDCVPRLLVIVAQLTLVTQALGERGSRDIGLSFCFIRLERVRPRLLHVRISWHPLS